MENPANGIVKNKNMEDGRMIREKLKNLAIAIAFNLMALMICLWIFQPVYETNDDLGLSMFASGVKGAYDGHMVYINYIYGCVEAFLYKNIPGIPFHSVLQYFFLFCAFTSILYVCLNKAKNRITVIPVVFGMLYFIYSDYVKLQYTKTAGVLAAAGIFLLIYAVSEERLYIISAIVGIMLTWVGFMLRSAQFLAELGILSAIALYLLLSFGGMEKKIIVKRMIRYSCAVLVLFLGIGLFYLADKKAYASEKWTKFQEYNELRTELFDYGWPSYDENAETYEKAGISKEAYSLYRTWNFMDTEVFTVDAMKQLVALKPKTKVNVSFIKNFLKTIPAGVFKWRYFWIFLIILFYWILVKRHDVREIITVLFSFGIISVLYLYLFYSGRYLFNRVDIGIWLAAILVLFWVLMDTVFDKNMLKKVLTLATALAICLLLSRINVADTLRSGEKNAKRTEKREEAKLALQEIASDTSHLYLAKVGQISIGDGYGVFERAPENLFSNSSSLGGWPCMTPLYLSVLEKYGVKNPYKDMIGNDNIYLIDDDIDATLLYLQEYYNENVSAQKVKKIGKKVIYRIRF